jgi:Rrf2 family protein
MRFSAKGEYGVRAILDIALYGERNPVRVREIARRQAIPTRFLEQVVASLKKGGLVESYRGARGGYRLARPAKEISLADVIQAVEGPIALVECIGEEVSACEQVSICVIRDIWQDVQDAVLEALDSVSLESVCRRKIKRDTEGASMYHI